MKTGCGNICRKGKVSGQNGRVGISVPYLKNKSLYKKHYENIIKKSCEGKIPTSNTTLKQHHKTKNIIALTTSRSNKFNP